jgi:hypothetical protein
VISYAYSVDPSGNVWGIGVDNSGNDYAVEWTVVPEPSAAILFPLAAGMCLRRRARRRDKC